MYQFISADGKIVAFSDEVRFIRQNTPDGAFVEAVEDTAQGVVIQGAPYNLAGRRPLSAVAGTVSLVTLTETEAVKVQAKARREAEIDAKKEYLTSTDYIVMKISEAMAEGDTETVTDLQNLYAPELAARRTARGRINDLQAEADVEDED